MSQPTRPAVGPNTVISQATLQTIDYLTNELTYREADDFNRNLTSIMEENHALGGKEHGFISGGETFIKTGYQNDRTDPVGPLHPSLNGKGRLHIKALKDLHRDTIRIKQGLALLIGHCVTHQEMRDALPEVMRDVHPSFSGLKRTRPEAWTLSKTPMKLHQYKIVEPTILLYYTHRILI